MVFHLERNERIFWIIFAIMTRNVFNEWYEEVESELMESIGDPVMV